MKNTLSKWFKIGGLAAALLLGAGVSYYTFFAPKHAVDAQLLEGMVPFDYERDAETIIKWFHRDWYWLISTEGYSIEFTLKNKAPKQDIRTAGKLNMWVLRDENDKLQGFTAYYMKTPTEGFLLFVLVNHEARGKRLGGKLTNFSLSKLWELGAQRVKLVTKTSNFRAHRLYTRLGFKESLRWNGFVYFEIKRP